MIVGFRHVCECRPRTITHKPVHVSREQEFYFLCKVQEYKQVCTDNSSVRGCLNFSNCCYLNNRNRRTDKRACSARYQSTPRKRSTIQYQRYKAATVKVYRSLRVEAQEHCRTCTTGPLAKHTYPLKRRTIQYQRYKAATTRAPQSESWSTVTLSNLHDCSISKALEHSRNFMHNYITKMVQHMYVL
jgi:hypothetical protein